MTGLDSEISNEHCHLSLAISGTSSSDGVLSGQNSQPLLTGRSRSDPLRWQRQPWQYLRWSTALNQGRGRFCSVRSRGIWSKKLWCHSLLAMSQNPRHTTTTTGGKYADKAHHFYTRLAPITRFIFMMDNDALLNYLNEERQSIEPTWYLPVVEDYGSVSISIHEDPQSIY
ncbi:uncharacterized protein [Triticum aestivum]|uniref:uncharacterized protein n=1 Tax=Triticum aestivum TaxID=4565 RepID=UPI001D03063F|nr:uncharacterized protein LOC123162916 [Triticum aestivum]